MKVELIHFTNKAREILYYSKNTRLMGDGGSFQDLLDKGVPEEEFEKVFSSISSPLEFVDYIFLISDVTRAFTHQLVRHRVGVAFAQQAQRVVNMENFGYMTPNSFADRHNDDETLYDIYTDLYDIYTETMEKIQEGYQQLIENGARPQDARGVLPTNVHTNILFKANLRMLLESAHIRLCVRAQGEFQQAMLKIREEVINVHPWVEKRMGPMCAVKGICAFPVFEDCPIKKIRPWLNGPCKDEKFDIFEDWYNLGGKYDPQPKGDGK
jgi:flavin-dependent thymidylate synthase